MDHMSEQTDPAGTAASAEAGRRATIRDVAARAGVSKSLVSLLYAGGKVSPERSERILHAAETLGFRPNMTARSLAASGGDFTGILVADLHNSVFAEIVDAARGELARHGRHALLTSAMMPDEEGNPQLDDRALAVFGDLRPRSILIVGSIPHMAQLRSFVPDVPVVVASTSAVDFSPAATVRSDDDAGMRLVVDHLVDRGHRAIAHIGGRGGRVAERRRSAYEEAMHSHGLGGMIRVADADYSETAGAEAARRLRAETSATAFACVNDLTAVGALSALSESESAPVAVTGYDDSALSQLRQVSLTSVDPQNGEIGRRAAATIIDIEREEAPRHPETLIAPHLVVRSSSAWPVG